MEVWKFDSKIVEFRSQTSGIFSCHSPLINGYRNGNEMSLGGEICKFRFKSGFRYRNINRLGLDENI